MRSEPASRRLFTRPRAAVNPGASVVRAPPPLCPSRGPPRPAPPGDPGPCGCGTRSRAGRAHVSGSARLSPVPPQRPAPRGRSRRFRPSERSRVTTSAAPGPGGVSRLPAAPGRAAPARTTGPPGLPAGAARPRRPGRAVLPAATIPAVLLGDPDPGAAIRPGARDSSGRLRGGSGPPHGSAAAWSRVRVRLRAPSKRRVPAGPPGQRPRSPEGASPLQPGSPQRCCLPRRGPARPG